MPGIYNSSDQPIDLASDLNYELRRADDEVLDWVTNNNRVPLSRCTLLPADMMTAPWLEFAAFEFSVIPFSP